jgi:hypothetical protein
MTDEGKAEKPATAASATQTVSQPNGDLARSQSKVTQLMNQGRAEVDALLEVLGMRQQVNGEAEAIAQLIERKLARMAWKSHAEALDELEIQRAFLAHRFIQPMKAYERSFRAYAALDNFLNLTSILAGIGASLTAALNASKVYAIVLGLVVGFLQSLSQWLKPSRRSVRRGFAASSLRSEAWAFLQGRDRYRGKDELAAWALLCDQVARVEERATAEQDKEAAEVPTPPHATR